MSEKNHPLIYIYPPNDKHYPEFQEIVRAFEDVNPEFSENASPARGGFEFSPSLHVSLKFVGEVALMWILSGVGTDAYKAMRSSVKKLLKIKPPRPSDWPKDFPNPKYVGIIMQIEVENHFFIADFSFNNEGSLTKALDLLPDFIRAL